MSENAPSIVICVSKSFDNERVLREALRGVEEESVPCVVLREADGDAASLSFTGAERSALEVGIGIDHLGEMAVHYRKLPPQRPLFQIHYKNEFAAIKGVCANAARLVKNTPFILN